MAHEHNGGEQPYESGGGAYEFPPLEHVGRDGVDEAPVSGHRPLGAEPGAGAGPADTVRWGPVPPGDGQVGPGPANSGPVGPAVSGYGQAGPGASGFGAAGQRQHEFARPGKVSPLGYTSPSAEYLVRALIFVAMLILVAVFVFGDTLGSVFGRLTAADRATAADQDPLPTVSASATTTAPPGTISIDSGSAPTRSAAATAAVLPGFQGVAVESRGIAYDVPADWEIDAPSVIRGFEGDGGRISGTGTATAGKDYCGANTRALTYVSRSQEADQAAAATEYGTSAAELGYDSSGWDRRATAPAPLTTSSGLPGRMVEISGNQIPDPAGCATEFSVYTFAFAGADNPTLVLTIATDRGVPGEVTPDQAREIFSTIRFLG
ncbi:hypothetical protein [Nocardia higoensis]|uniref:hypothetical protein n=1 Tax=Nocardia higoensis TaxID=228599 RepID=UPI00059499FF|nr:hypothetical protein [Nocardia higoensis]